MRNQRKTPGDQLQALAIAIFNSNDETIQHAMNLLEAVPAGDVLHAQAVAVVERCNAIRARLFLVMGEARVRP